MEVEKRQANEGLALTCCQQKAAHRLWGEAERTAAQRSAREQRSQSVSVAERGWRRLAEVVRASSSSRHCSPEERRCYGHVVLLGRHLLEGLVDNRKFARNRLKLLQHLRCRSRAEIICCAG